MNLRILFKRYSNIYFFLACLLLLSIGCKKEATTEEEEGAITNQDTDDLSISLEGDLQISDFIW